MTNYDNELDKKEIVEEMINMLFNFNKFFLGKKEHIKKYKKLRRLHQEVISSMSSYFENYGEEIDLYFNLIKEDITRETKLLSVELDYYNDDDRSILFELFIYKNHKKIPSLTEKYIKQKRFRNKDKIKMLYCMRDSFASLFKITDIDHVNGYVTYEDVFTHKKYKIIDIAMSSTPRIDESKTIYTYNRLIKFDDITFATGVHCMMLSEHKGLKEFLKKHNYKTCSDFSRCLILYYLSKNNNNLKMGHNSNF